MSTPQTLQAGAGRYRQTESVDLGVFTKLKQRDAEELGAKKNAVSWMMEA